MVGDDLLGTGSVVHVPLITGVGMLFELQACHIDMEGCKVYRHGMLVHMPPLFWTSKVLLSRCISCVPDGWQLTRLGHNRQEFPSVHELSGRDIVLQRLHNA
jgi:hypothetical protein